MNKPIKAVAIIIFVFLFLLAEVNVIFANEYERSFNTISVGPFEHNEKEVLESPVFRPGSDFIQHQKYFKNERDLYGYNPRFMPGEVHFDHQNRPWLRSGNFSVKGTTTKYHDQYDSLPTYIQTLNNKGDWVAWKIEKILRDNGYEVSDGDVRKTVGSTEMRVISDKEGNIYTVANVGGKGQKRKYLLFLPARSEKWKAFKLRYGGALESTDEFADSSSPPLLIAQVNKVNLALTFIIRDGRDGLVFTYKEIPCGQNAPFIGVGSGGHSGAGPATVVKGGLIYISYYTMQKFPGKSGTPQYLRVYNREKDEVSEPMLIGFGGHGKPDNHNSPSIIATKTGQMFYFFGTHLDSILVKKTKGPIKGFNPLGVDPIDPESWKTEFNLKGELTYLGLLMDNKRPGTWHLITRDSVREGEAYIPHVKNLTYFRNGEKQGILVRPAYRDYSVFYHKLTQDRKGRLFLSYMYNALRVNYTKDNWKEMVPKLKSKPSYWVPYNVWKPPFWDEYKRKWGAAEHTKPHDPVIIMSDDGGDTWKFALTDDFMKGISK